MADERTLFDDSETADDWREVPQERFLSWSLAEQLTYCAARDYASAEASESAEDARWFIERATSYQQLIEGLRG